MAYVLQAVVANHQTLVPEPKWIGDSKVVSLHEGIAMVPITAALYDQFIAATPVGEGQLLQQFTYLSEAIAEELRLLSVRGGVAYVEADFFGGTGVQQAVVWNSGAMVLRPILTHGHGAINQALHLLGVDRRGRVDEFDVVDLGRYRSNRDWLELART